MIQPLPQDMVGHLRRDQSWLKATNLKKELRVATNETPSIQANRIYTLRWVVEMEGLIKARREVDNLEVEMANLLEDS